jgi:hypothetical protein
MVSVVRLAIDRGRGLVQNLGGWGVTKIRTAKASVLFSLILLGIAVAVAFLPRRGPPVF